MSKLTKLLEFGFAGNAAQSRMLNKQSFINTVGKETHALLQSERTAIAVGAIGLNVNKTQSTPGDIDTAWSFFGAAGNHTTISDVSILSDDGNGNVTLDFSG